MSVTFDASGNIISNGKTTRDDRKVKPGELVEKTTKGEFRLMREYGALKNNDHESVIFYAADVATMNLAAAVDATRQANWPAFFSALTGKKGSTIPGKNEIAIAKLALELCARYPQPSRAENLLALSSDELERIRQELDGDDPPPDK